MEDNKDIKGYIESFKDGFIRGWASINSALNQPNICDLYIDGQFISQIEARIYREDLKDASIRSGIAGFLTPIPLVFCDNKEHTVTLHKNNSDVVLNTKTLKLTSNKHLIPVDENVVFDFINQPYSNHKKVMFLAGFTNQPALLNYQKHFVQTFQKAGFYVVYIIASNTPETLTGILGDADRVIVRKNIGYDFGSWATAIDLCQQECFKAEEIIWANDSIIGPISSIDALLKKVERSTSDIWAVTDSQDRKYHFQSYFWGVKKKANQFIPVLDAFFYYRHGLPQDKDEAISHYEIEALSFFKKQGVTVDILFPEQFLVSLAKNKFTEELDRYSEKWQTLFNLPLKKNDHHNLNKNVLNLANILINQLATNPSHMYWNVLLDLGFPFIKRELLTLNPANYPFPHQFSSAFEEDDATDLISDLSGAYKLSRII